MKKVFTLLLLVSVLLTPTKVFADITDDTKINGTVMGVLDQWDSQTYQNVLGLLEQGLSYDTSGLAAVLQSAVAGMRNGTEFNFDPTVIKGHFKVVNGSWTMVEDVVDDLRLEFDANGMPCVISLTFDGDKKQFWMESDVTEEDIPVSLNSLGIMTTFSKLLAKLRAPLVGVEKINVTMPEKVNLTVSVSGMPMMMGNVTFDLSCFDDNWHFMTNGLMLSTNLTFMQPTGGTFDITHTNIGYKPGTGLNYDFNVGYSGQSILSLRIWAPGTFQMPTGTDMSFGFESLNVEADLAGSIQVKGGIPSVHNFVETVIAVLSAGEEQAPNHRAGQLLSDILKLELFYDNGGDPKAEMTLQIEQTPFQVTENLVLPVKPVPVIIFSSDNEIRPFKDYFTAERFPEIATKLSEIIGQASGLINEITEKVRNATAISEVQDSKAISFKDGQLSVTGQKAGAKVEVYTIDGRLCSTATVNSEGHVSVQMPSAGRGVYIVKTPAGTQKLMIR